MNTLPEKLTYIGLMLTDLRGSWGPGYEDRIDCVIEEILLALKMTDLKVDMKRNLKQLLLICTEELINIENKEEDGRVFRDFSALYGYKDEEFGLTKSVSDKIKEDMEYPENCFLTSIYFYPTTDVDIILTDEGIIDTISGLAIISNIAFLKSSTDLENKTLISSIKAEGIKYAVCGDTISCMTKKTVVKCPATYYNKWEEVPSKFK